MAMIFSERPRDSMALKAENPPVILVSGASGIVGYGILKCLQAAKRPFHLIGTSIYADSVAEAFCNTFEPAIASDHPDYMDWLVSIIKKHHVRYLIPGIEADLYLWAKNERAIVEAGGKALLNRLELLEFTKDKWLFDQKLKEAEFDCRIPTTISDDWDELESKLGIPFLLKPRRGYGSRGIFRVSGRAEFDPHRDKVGRTHIAQAIRGRDDQEYTVAAFGDGKGGLCAFLALRRTLSKEGFTEKAETVEIPALLTEVIALSKYFKPIGPTNFQFRMESGKVFLLEINPRISSSTSIRSAFGFNEPVMAVEYLIEDKLPSQPTLKTGRAVRYSADCIFYSSCKNDPISHSKTSQMLCHSQ